MKQNRDYTPPCSQIQLDDKCMIHNTKTLFFSSFARSHLAHLTVTERSAGQGCLKVSLELNQIRAAGASHCLCRRRVSHSRNSNLGYFYLRLSTDRSVFPRPASCAPHTPAVPVTLSTVVQRLRGSPTHVADVDEGPAQVFAPHGVDDRVDGGVEQAQHAAKGEHSLDEVVHPPKEVIDHDGKQRAPADDEGHQDQHQGFSQTQVHSSLLGPHSLHFSPFRGVDDDAPLRAAAQHADSVVVGFPEDEHVGVDNEQQQNGCHADPEH